MTKYYGQISNGNLHFLGNYKSKKVAENVARALQYYAIYSETELKKLSSAINILLKNNAQTKRETILS